MKKEEYILVLEDLLELHPPCYQYFGQGRREPERLPDKPAVERARRFLTQLKED